MQLLLAGQSPTRLPTKIGHLEQSNAQVNGREKLLTLAVLETAANGLSALLG